MKNGKWDTKGVITEVRVADDGTVSSYDLMIGYLLTISCGMTTDIKGENNKVRNKQRVNILSPNIELVNYDGQCSKWQMIGSERFEWIVLSFVVIALIHWRLGKIFQKKGLLETM